MSAAALDAAMETAIGRQRAGRLAEAEALYRQVLAERPRHPVAHHNLAVLCAQRGAVDAALPHFKLALEIDPDQPVYWLSYARALLVSGRPEPAARLLETGRSRGLAGAAVDALLAEARVGLGDGFAARGDLPAAIGAYRAALEADPGFAEAHHHLGSVLSESGAVAEGFAHLMRRAALVHGEGAPEEPDAPPHRLKHDREQREHLASLGVRDAFHLGDGARLDGPAVNPGNATAELLARWREAEPQVVVLDDFLTPEALANLRRFCAESTIWRRNYEAGYIGATPPDGFACPLLAQIAEEIVANWPEIFGPHRFRYLGGFKYDSEYSSGTNTHADYSAVNVNLYIAPDEANLDPASGGMEIWNICAPDEPAMRRLNSDEAAARDYLARAGATSMIVPHRANRAVFFNSGLFHRTDRCRFREGYLMKRINVSLLFGDFGAPTR
jgi:tetratricopeptide (TPR) repeat protein